MLVIIVCHFLEAVEFAALTAVAGIVERQYHRCGLIVGERAIVGHARNLFYILRDVHTHEVVALAVDGHAGPFLIVIEGVLHHHVAILRCVVVAVVEEAVLVAIHYSVVGGRGSEVGGRDGRCGCGAALPPTEVAGVVAVRHVEDQTTFWIDERAAAVVFPQRLFVVGIFGGSEEAVGECDIHV